MSAVRPDIKESIAPFYPWANGRNGSSGPRGVDISEKTIVYHLGDKPMDPRVKEDIFARLGTLPVGALVLDAASGDGRILSSAPEERPYSLVSADINQNAVRAVRKKIIGGNARDFAVAADVTRLPFPEGAFNAATIYRALHNIPVDPEVALKEVGRVIRHGGNLLWTTLSDQDKKRIDLDALGIYKPGEVNDCAPVMGLDKPWNLRFYSAGDIEQLSAGTGFKLEELSSFQEQSGFSQLAGQSITYHYAVLRRL